MQAKAIDIFYPTSQQDWREWLIENHESKTAVWLVQYNKASAKPTISWSEAVDVALCFGWIDSKKIAIDKEKTHQFFSKRKPKGTWSKINKAKVERLMAEGQMAPAGLAAITAAKQNGSWTILNDVEDLKIPKDLEKAFKAHKGSKVFFMGLSKSVKKYILQWIALAKRPETRQARIDEIVVLASQRLKPKQFR